METKIKAADTTYGEFHRNASEVYFIPSLQRPYTWEPKEVEKLWDDILENNPPYYIGNIVAIVADGTTGRDQIIDGQQRLTTLSLFLIAIKDYIAGKNGKGFSEIHDEILDLLIKFRRQEEQVRLSFSNENSSNVYMAMVNGLNLEGFKSETQKRFIKNLDFIKQALAAHSPECNLDEIQDIFSRIKNIQLIFTRCQDKSAAYKLFESINATGISLATTDMVKNHVFESLRKDKKMLEYAEAGWIEMCEIFNENISHLKTYIRHHWIGTVGYTSHSRLYDDFIKKFKDKDEILKFIKSLFDLSPIYVALREGAVEGLENLPRKRYELDEIRETLKFLSFLGVDQVYPVLLSSYCGDSENFKKDMIRFTAFQFLYKYVPGSPSVPEKKFFADFCVKKIGRQDVVKGLLGLCEKYEVQFVQKLNQNIKYLEGRSGDVQFLLEKYLYYKGGSKKFAKPTIEHIVPQDLSDPIFGKFKLSKKDGLRKINQLGNLTILELEENSSKAEFNKPFSEKKELYQGHQFLGNKDILNYPFEEDPESAIQRRGDDIARVLFKIFIEALKDGKWKTEKEIK